MQPSSYVPSFYFYKLAQAVSGPYTALNAYSAGNIDAGGNVLKSISSIDPFEYLVIKLKKIFDELPYGTTKAKLSNYMATLQLFSEEAKKYEITKDQFDYFVEGIVSLQTKNSISYLELLEDMGTGGGAGALGVPAEGGTINQGGISGRDIRLGLPVMKRKKGNFFGNCDVFDVCPEDFIAFKNAKQWGDIPDGQTKNYLRRFGRRNSGRKMGVKGISPVTGTEEIVWINYPSHDFLENVDLSSLSAFLAEDTN